MWQREEIFHDDMSKPYIPAAAPLYANMKDSNVAIFEYNALINVDYIDDVIPPPPPPLNVIVEQMIGNTNMLLQPARLTCYLTTDTDVMLRPPRSTHLSI